MTNALALQALASRRGEHRRVPGGAPIGRWGPGAATSREEAGSFATSQVLKGAGLVTDQRDGNRRIYVLDLDGIEDLRTTSTGSGTVLWPHSGSELKKVEEMLDE